MRLGAKLVVFGLVHERIEFLGVRHLDFGDPAALRRRAVDERCSKQKQATRASKHPRRQIWSNAEQCKCACIFGTARSRRRQAYPRLNTAEDACTRLGRTLPGASAMAIPTPPNAPSPFHTSPLSISMLSVPLPSRRTGLIAKGVVGLDDIATHGRVDCSHHKRGATNKQKAHQKGPAPPHLAAATNVLTLFEVVGAPLTPPRTDA